MNCDFDRVNYGIRIDHLNLTGRKDKFKIKFQQGYTRKYELEYNFPYPKGTWGVGAVISYAENKSWVSLLRAIKGIVQAKAR